MKTGDRVVCVDDSVGKIFKSIVLIKDKIYTVEGTFTDCNGLGIIPREIKSNSPSGGWVATRFRPLDETFATETIANLIQWNESQKVTV